MSGAEGDVLRRSFQMDFSIDELRARRAKIMEAVGNQAVAIVQGSAKNRNHNLFRQNNDFYYLSGVEVPHAYLLLDGRSGKSTLFLAHQSQEHRNKEGEIMSAENADIAREITGMETVLGIESLAQSLENIEMLYVPYRQAEGPAMSSDTLQRSQTEINSDPWDGRPDRSSHLIALLRQRLYKTEIRNLDPFLNELRLVKSVKEIELLRVAGLLAALGTIEAMKSTRPGIMEYQLEAVMRYHFLANGGLDAGYRAIIAGGANAWYGHYNANNSSLCDGDLVLVDGAPDYHYYTSDIGRMWPVNGTYSPLQRELYGFIVRYYQVFLSLIRPGVTDEQIRLEAREQMAEVVEKTRFSKEIYQAAARRCLDFPYHLSHPVGMTVHDVGHYRGKILIPGIVLTLDPQLIIPEERLYLRVEDTLVITQDGLENFTVSAPANLDETEKLMREPGLLERYPPQLH
jgi:Xaa-Pro aminopeptidase